MPPKGEILYRAFPLNLDSLQSPPLIDRFFIYSLYIKTLSLKEGGGLFQSQIIFEFKFILVRRKRVKVKMSKIWVKHTTFVV